MVRAELRMRLTHSQLCLQGGLQVLKIGGRSLVQDDEINGQLLHPPIFVGAQQLPRDVDVLDVIDAQQHDRQIAGDAVSPKCGRRAGSTA